MEQAEIKQVIEGQRKYFDQGYTLEVEKRVQALKRWRTCILAHEEEIYEALKMDLGKSDVESYMCEVGMALDGIKYMLKHIRRFAKTQRVRTPLAQFPSKSYRMPSPKGVVLIISPWNYPFLLTVGPMTDAIAAGNTIVLKPSEYSPHTSQLLEKMIGQCFDPRHVKVITGAQQESIYLLQEAFDHIFFTGSSSVGKIVMTQAAKHLTPVTLELGGKSPCIVDKSANLKIAARRIVFGKYLNCGQTCVAPDYILCEESVKEKLIKELKKQIQKQYGKHIFQNPQYGKIINEKHYDRLLQLIDEEKVIYGGRTRRERLQIEPTILDGITWEDAVMGEEIFGPILPIVTVKSIEEAVSMINEHPHPLALYLFTSKQKIIDLVTKRCRYGGGCINDTIIHLATNEMEFGGFRESGMGSYHGKSGFDTFTHYKCMVDKKTWLDIKMRYQPYHKSAKKLIKCFLK